MEDDPRLIVHLIDPSNRFLKAHECSYCKYLVIIPFSCKNLCLKFCQECLKKVKKCEECGCEESEFQKDENCEKNINKRYKVSCKTCFKEMMPNQFDLVHLNKECKIKCMGKNFEGHCKQEYHKSEKMKLNYHQMECQFIENNKVIDYPLYSRLIYILIAVDEYKEDTVKNLEAPTNDVKDLGLILEKNGFEKREQNILKKPDKKDIGLFLKNFKEEMDGENDEEKKFNSHSMIFFYFSGHGMQNEETGIYEICPHDYNNKTLENGINLQHIVEYFFKLNCMHVLIVLDCCFGGGIFR